VIYGNQSDRVFDIHPEAKLTLIGISVAGGMANEPGTVHGGAFRVAAEARLELQNVTVSGNIANVGGAIYSDGLVQIYDSEFYHNAIVDHHVNNQFTDGAAILNRGKLAVINSTFRANGVIPGGDGIVLAGEHVIHSRPGFTSNPLTNVYNSTFYDNTNGLFSDGVPTLVFASTFVGNGQRGLRFLLDLDNLGVEQHRVVGTVLYGHAGDCNGIPENQIEYAVADLWNASSDETCGFTGNRDHQNISYPFLGGPGNHGGPTPTFMPRSDGILIDAPDYNCAMDLPIDQRGEPRPADGSGDGTATCDIGAVEYQPGSDPAVPDGIFGDRFQKD
jgi:predicted outer membrane repeat protein